MLRVLFVPLVVNAVIGLALSLIAHVIVVVYVLAILHRIFVCGRYTRYNKKYQLFGTVTSQTSSLATITSQRHISHRQTMSLSGHGKAGMHKHQKSRNF